jgi:hypothetical protein
MNSKILPKPKLILIAFFAIAMGFLETAVVVYLREILYPTGFSFPLAPISQKLATIEFLREAATLIMLVSIGWLSGRSRLEKFVLFLYTFAIWDIFYYIFLKLLINWPESLFTWDILFLIPVTWTGPVLAPVISSISMIILAYVIVSIQNEGQNTFMRLREWTILLAGAIFEFLAYIWDYSRYILHSYSPSELWTLRGKSDLFSLAVKYIPVSFNWLIFLIGELLILTSILLLFLRYKKLKQGEK